MADSTPAAILFDLDGTLTDPFEGITKSIRYAMERMGHVPPEAETLRWCIGPPLGDAFSRLLDTSDDDRIAHAVRLYRERYSDVGKFENTLIDGIPEILEALSGQGFAMWVATSKLGSYANEILDHFGLRRHFRALYGGQADGTHARKPELIAHILDYERIDPSRAAMIGDRSHDVAGAAANAIPAIGVLWGYGDREELETAGADWIAEAPDDILRIVAAAFPMTGTRTD